MRHKKQTHLGNAEVGEDDAAQARRAPDEEHLGLEASVTRTGVDEVGRGVADTEVPEPVGGGSERHGLGTDVERVDFTNDDPSDGTPCARKGSNVNANKRDEGLLARGVGDRDSNADDRDEVLADTHDDGTPDEERATTETLNTPHAGNGHEDVDNVGGNLGQEGVLDTRVGEERSTV